MIHNIDKVRLEEWIKSEVVEAATVLHEISSLEFNTHCTWYDSISKSYDILLHHLLFPTPRTTVSH